MRLIIVYIFLLFVSGVSYSQNDSINKFNLLQIDSLTNKGLSEIFLIKKHYSGSVTGHLSLDQKESCLSRNQFVLFWFDGNKTKLIVSNDCYFSDTYSLSDSLYKNVQEIFNNSDSIYTEYTINSSLLNPNYYEIYRIDSTFITKRDFNIIGINKANQNKQNYIRLLNILDYIYDNMDAYDHIIKENWR